MHENFGKCQRCGGPLIPLFLPGSLVCLRECDLAPPTCKPLQLDQTEGDSEWAGRMMSIDSGAIMRCISCSCPGANPGTNCEGAEYRVNNYTGQVMWMGRSGWTWVRIAVQPDEIDVWFPKSFPGHKWRNVGG